MYKPKHKPMNTEEIDNIIPPFSEEREQIRKDWNEYCTAHRHINWDDYLMCRAENKIASLSTTYKEQLNKLVESAVSKLQELIEAKGTESEHSSSQCLKIKDNNVQYNLEAGRYLDEVTENNLIDDFGYSYGFYGVLDTEELLSVIDYLVEEYDK